MIFCSHWCCALSSLTGWTCGATQGSFGEMWNIDWHRFSRFIIITLSCSGLFSQFLMEDWCPRSISQHSILFKIKNKNLWQKQNKKLTSTAVLRVTHSCKKATLYSSVSILISEVYVQIDPFQPQRLHTIVLLQTICKIKTESFPFLTK